ncbi:hypothetical protein AB5I41_09630 [Sphingomonas sp. MMS24-JH45]
MAVDTQEHQRAVRRFRPIAGRSICGRRDRRCRSRSPAGANSSPSWPKFDETLADRLDDVANEADPVRREALVAEAR